MIPKIKKHYPAIFLIWLIFSLSSCTLQPPLKPDYEYGKAVDYGEKIHPGVDYGLEVGTPVIACADGRVTRVEPNHH